MLLGVALGVLLLAIQPVRAQEAPPSLSNAETQFDYAEDGTGPITTFNARDPENKPVFWTVGGTDAADFTIVGGTLRFKSPPNYEVPTDRDERADTTTGTPEGVGDNVYKVTVRFGAGGEDGDPDPTDDYDGDDLGEIDLTVNVTNVNEPGEVVISPRQPQVGTLLTAILTDEDNVAPGVGEWQWARSDSMTSTSWEDIPTLSDEMTYRPTIDDLGMYLQVTVVYVDRAGSDPRTVQGVSKFKVRKDIVTSNQRPKFPDQSTLVGGNAIVRIDTDRFISETAAAGTKVGAPVTAFDDRTDIEEITYSLRDDEETLVDSDTNPDTPMHNDGHAASFNIHEVTGQITVSASAMLDADGTDGAGAGATNPYNVVVRAVDGDGETQDIDVTIGVLQAAEPPMIERAYLTGRVPTGHAVGDRAPTEMSHYEADRENQTATVIDTNLDTEATVEPATYYANDPDAGSTFTWSLEGPDGGSFSITEDTAVTPGSAATLAFASGPDFEEEGDANGDNVYEVTIVVTDNQRLRDTLDVTVKVLNSTDDNQPGSVSFTNRQPEVATALTAMFEDPDAPVTQLQWQWYRAQVATDTGECAGRTPTGAEHRGFIADTTEATVGGELVEQITIDGTVWTKIDGATSSTYTPEANDAAELTDVGRCLRATVTYRDAVDRTHSGADDTTTDVNETLEGTYGGAEQPVKAIDERNQAPVFKESDYGSARVSVYRAEVAENSGAVEITDVDAAVDVFTFDDGDSGTTDDSVEDDEANDLLTYSLSGRDASSFSIVGTIDNPTPAAADDDGTLTFSGGADFEGQREYRVIITATDPSGDSGSVEVIIDITNINERPGFTMGEDSVVYMENGTAAVDTYRAADPEGSGITYSLVTEAIAEVQDTDGSGAIAAVEEAAFADETRFEIGSISGILSFKESPNFEEARDAGADNMYQVTVQATVSDNENPRHFATQEVTVIVTDVNEAPVFFEITDALEITENPDDPNKEPPTAAGYLYLLNRGVGKPSADLPADPNLDVGIPIVAVDDDNNGPDIDPSLTGISTDRQLTDGLTYELSGADAEPFFHIVPATGQILTLEKVDYETKDEYNVTVKATDLEGLYGSIDLTISVIDVDEVPVPKVLRIAGESSHTYEENGTDALDEYTVAAGGGATAGSWTLEGPDAGVFDITGGSLTFKAAPDYENPRGAAMSDTNTNTYEVTLKVTDSSESDVFGTFAVTITVTNVDELGTLTSPAIPAEYMENGTDALGTFTTDGPVTPTWTLEGYDAGAFDITGGALTFAAAPDYENPADANTDNTYMVTVKADAGGETDMATVTVMVTDANELGTLTSPDISAEYMENGTDALGTFTTDGPVTPTWTLEGADAEAFGITGGALTFAAAPDYENPADADGDNTYMITVKAEAGGEMAMADVTVMVTNANELGTLTSPTISAEYMENGTDALGTFTTDGPVTPTWTLEGADAEAFGITGGALTFAAAPDYENPADADGDNTYMITVKAEAGGEMAMADVTVMVTDANDAPMFADATADRDIAENTAAGMNIGGPVTAMDEDGDTLTYTLSGMDAASFDIDGATGQLMTKAALDYETKSSYTVTVTATDPDGATDTITVTINVTDVAVENVAPTFTDGATATRSVDENSAAGMNVGGPVMATDSDGDTLAYTLGGTDAASFDIDSATGQLMTKAALDYETKSSYSVMVTATDDSGEPNNTDSIDVTINVTNVDEMGMLELSTMSPTVGVALAATLTDPDGSIANVDWQWSRSTTIDGTFTHIDEETMTYTPTAGDVGHYLKVVARYTDGQGPNKDEDATTGKVSAAPNPVLIKFDTNGNGRIDRSEAIAALRSYRAGAATRSEAIAVLRLYRDS